MNQPRIAFDFAIVRVLPHVHLYAAVNVGVVLHARTAEFIAASILTDPAQIGARVADVDLGRLSAYLESYRRIAAGDPEGGPMALAPPSERFHWLTAPRSDLIQCSPVHGGLSADPAATLRALFDQYVGFPSNPAASPPRPQG